MLIGQPITDLALGYKDMNDHHYLRFTLNRLEHPPRNAADRYRKIAVDRSADWFVKLFLDTHVRAPPEIVLDLDATDDPLHGHQEGRFFHDYYVWLLLLSATLRVLRPPPARCQAALLRYRRVGRCRRRGRPRDADSLVRHAPRRLPP